MEFETCPIHQEIQLLSAFVIQFEHQWVTSHHGEVICACCGAWQRGSVGGCLQLATEHRLLADEQVKRILDARARFNAHH